MFEETFGRLIRRLSKTILKAAKNPETFSQKLTELEEAEPSKWAEILLPAVTAICSMADIKNPNQVAENFSIDAVQRCIKELDSAENVEAITEKWEQDLPAQFANEILSLRGKDNE